MPIPSTSVGLIAHIKATFNGTNSLTAYYRNGSYVPTNPTTLNIPTSGAINFYAFRGADYRYSTTYTITSNTNNFNVRDYITNNIENIYGTITSPIDFTLIVDTGVYVTSTSTGSYAIDTGGSWPTGSTLTIINRGYIIGRGGDGGNGISGSSGPNGSAGGGAILARIPVTINNASGYIFGGGGGGAGAPSYIDLGDTTGAPGGGGGAGGGTGGSVATQSMATYSSLTVPTAGTSGTNSAPGSAGSIGSGQYVYGGGGGGGGDD